MNSQNISVILIIIGIILAIVALNKYNRSTEPFHTMNLSGNPTQSYLRYQTDPTQINQVYHPFYNWPEYEYIGKYPYYHYMFNPYSSSVYYT